MEDFVMGLVPQATNYSIGHWFQNMTHLTDHQLVSAFPMAIKVAAVVLMTFGFEAWKRGFGEKLGTHYEANKN